MNFSNWEELYKLDDGRRWWRGAYRMPANTDPAHDVGAHVLILGEDNPQSADPRCALFPSPERCAGHRLREMLGLPTNGRYLQIWRTNLCCPTWSMPKAVDRACELLDSDAPWSTILMMGRKVTGAVCRALDRAEYGPWQTDRVMIKGTHTGDERPMRLASLPHPSGRNQTWNVPANAQKLRMLVHGLAPELWSDAHPDETVATPSAYYED